MITREFSRQNSGQSVRRIAQNPMLKNQVSGAAEPVFGPLQGFWKANSLYF